jgi:hypothetical protein
MPHFVFDIDGEQDSKAEEAAQEGSVALSDLQAFVSFRCPGSLPRARSLQ